MNIHVCNNFLLSFFFFLFWQTETEGELYKYTNTLKSKRNAATCWKCQILLDGSYQSFANARGNFSHGPLNCIHPNNFLSSRRQWCSRCCCCCCCFDIKICIRLKSGTGSSSKSCKVCCICWSKVSVFHISVKHASPWRAMGCQLPQQLPPVWTFRTLFLTLLLLKSVLTVS